MNAFWKQISTWGFVRLHYKWPIWTCNSVKKPPSRRIAGKGPHNMNSPIWTELLCSSFFSLSLLSKSCDSCFLCSMLAFAVFFCLPPSSRSSSPIGPITRDGCHPNQPKILLWDDQIQSLKKRCNAFIPDFFGVHDMYLLEISIYGHSRWFVCIFGRENQMLHRLQLLRAVLVWTQMKLQQKQEVISDFPKKSKKYFNTRGEKSISPRVRNPSKEWRRKTHEKKLKERYLSHSYVFNLFKSSRYFDYTSYYTPYLDPKLHHYQEPHQFWIKLFTNSPGRDFVLLLYKSWVLSIFKY